MPLLDHLAKLSLLLGGLTLLYELLPEDTQARLDDKLSSIVNLRNVLISLGSYAAVALCLYAFFIFGAYLMPFISIVIVGIVAALTALALASSDTDNVIANGCALWIVQVLVVAIIVGIMWLFSLIIPRSVITWCFWPYTQLSTLVHHIDSYALNLLIPVATGTDVANHFEKSNALISNYLESWNKWPWWLFAKPPFNWLFTIYVHSYIPVLIITEVILQIGFLIVGILLFRILLYTIIFISIRTVDYIKNKFGTSKRRIPILGILLVASGGVLDYLAFLVEK